MPNPEHTSAAPTRALELCVRQLKAEFVAV